MEGNMKTTSLLLAHENSYLQEFDAIVTDLDEIENAAVLDKTAFFPGGGGQPNDLGWLNQTPVIKTKRQGEQIWHWLDGNLPEINSTVHGRLDWDRRYKLMRTHTAFHILCGVVWRDYKAQVTGGNMDILKGRMDFEFETLRGELVKEIEEKLNTEVAAARDVIVRILSRQEAFKIPDLIRTKINLLPPHISEIRTVEIQGLDLQADGGTHVANTREVGTISIVDYKSKGKINKRIWLKIED
jgi:misacylated tRNA(Ala) deacylase